MKTTVLFVEHLITGIQASVWIVLLVFSFFGYDWISLDGLKNFATIGTLLVLSVIYSIGVFVDDLADRLLKRWSERIRDRRMVEEDISGESLSIMKTLKEIDNEFLSNYIGYIRSRIRISRATFFNFSLITVSAVVFTCIQLDEISPQLFWKLVIFEIIIGMAIAVAALLSWLSITNTFAKQVIRMHKMVASATS
ncbi:MAG: hypothetical protein ACE5HI_12465 [bacterium]